MLKINNKNLNQIFVRAVVSRGSQCAYISDDHAMKTAWLINDVVLFEPDERRLCAIQNYPAQCIILHGPVNECLLQLLLHNGEVLSQRFYLMRYGESRGRLSQPTLYIKLLRQSEKR
jgi:hypothetical protein